MSGLATFTPVTNLRRGDTFTLGIGPTEELYIALHEIKYRQNHSKKDIRLGNAVKLSTGELVKIEGLVYVYGENSWRRTPLMSLIDLTISVTGFTDVFGDMTKEEVYEEIRRMGFIPEKLEKDAYALSPDPVGHWLDCEWRGDPSPAEISSEYMLIAVWPGEYEDRVRPIKPECDEVWQLLMDIHEGDYGCRFWKSDQESILKYQELEEGTKFVDILAWSDYNEDTPVMIAVAQYEAWELGIGRRVEMDPGTSVRLYTSVRDRIEGKKNICSDKGANSLYKRARAAVDG